MRFGFEGVPLSAVIDQDEDDEGGRCGGATDRDRDRDREKRVLFLVGESWKIEKDFVVLSVGVRAIVLDREGVVVMMLVMSRKQWRSEAEASRDLEASCFFDSRGKEAFSSAN